MLSKAQIKYIRSLTQQKYRKEHNVFIAEGDKIAREWLSGSQRLQYIIGLPDWLEENKALIAGHNEAAVIAAEESELTNISTLQTAHKALLVVEMAEHAVTPYASGWSIALDRIQDPGNMGTIIRIADWFGISQILLSPDCVDVYNPKVVQAAMGGHLRVRFCEVDLYTFVKTTSVPVLAATLSGNSIYDISILEEAVLLIGNESKGLDPVLTELASHKVTIPGKGGAESLNAAVSAGIICSHLMPR